MNKQSEDYKLPNASFIVQPPIAFPAPGVYDSPHMITLLCATPNARIHYTMDGSLPTKSSPVFDPYRLVPLEQFGHDHPQGHRSYTIRAVATISENYSSICEFTYDIVPRDQDAFISQEVFPGILMIRDYQNNKMYLIRGTQRALLIDAGMSNGDLHDYVIKRIGDLPLDVFITHGHPDHIAAMGQFQGDYDVYMHHADLPLAQLFKESLHFHINLENIIHVEEGAIFNLGDRQLQVFHIPGHSKGCLALFDEQNGILISGDAFGSNGPTIVDALWLHMSQEGVDLYLSALQVFHSKVAGKVKYICGGHGALYLEGESYLDNLERAAQQLVDQGVDILVPSPRPSGVWKSVYGDRLTDPNWASINVNRDTCLSALPDKISSLSNLQVFGAVINETFKPNIFHYTANTNPDTQKVEIVPTPTSQRYSALTINNNEAGSGQPSRVRLGSKDNNFSIKVVAPDGKTESLYSLVITKSTH